MTAEATALATLGTRLVPWLREPLSRLEAARASGRLGHGWLLTGPAGIGKINLALVFADRLLGGKDSSSVPDVLDAAPAAAAMRERHAPADHHPDLHWVFPEEDKRTISVEQIRAVAESLALKGFRGGGKVVIVEPADAMTAAAANALLKTLEEPAEQTYLLLISHQPDRLLPTIRSRCQKLVVPPPAEDIAGAWLGAEQGGSTDPILLMFRRAPFRALEVLDGERTRFLNSLEARLNLVSSKKLDPASLAQEWVKADVELALEWLMRRLERSIRLRLTQEDSNTVTPRPGDPLHNSWLFLPVDALFGRLEAAGKLRDQLGSGINIELALHVLLLGLTPNRGQT